MELSFYLGVAVDTFAAGDTRRYLNPGDSAGKDERFVGGFDFGFRLWGKQQEGTKKQDAESKPKYYTRQLWIYGETVHGVRSAEIDCKAHSDFPTCKDLLTPNDLTTNPAGHLIYLLRNASSLEGFMGLRYEFLPIHKDGDSSAILYAKAQAGFLKVSGSPDSAADLHHVGLGILSTKGPF